MITTILNFPTKNTFTYYFQYFRKLCKRMAVQASYFGRICVCFKSCIWKTSMVKSNHLFFNLEKKDLGLTLWAKNDMNFLKRINDTFKCLTLPKKITK